MKSALIAVLLYLILYLNGFSQHDFNWVFDSTLVTFNANGVVATGSSKAKQLTTETSWSNSNGELVVYTSGYTNSALYNGTHNLVANSSLIRYSNPIQGIIFLPIEQSSKIAVISQDAFSDSSAVTGHSVWYHVYDILSDSLIHKNELFLPLGIGFKMATGATRHANGRDWWVVNHESVGRKFYTTLVTQHGFGPPLVQELGRKHGFDTPSGNGGGAGGSILFSKNGEKLIVTSLEGIIEEFSFDRCSGLLSFVRTIHPGVMDFSRLLYYSTLSPDGNILYVSNNNAENDTYQIEQYDLSSSDPWGSRYEVVNMGSGHAAYSVQLGPDGRVYFMAGYWGTGTGLYDTDHMQVIHQPNVMGPGCQFQANGVSLPPSTGLRDLSLPYFINYNLKAQPNSPCDTLGIGYSAEKPLLPQRLSAYPNPGKDYCQLELPPDFSGEITTLLARDIQGRELTLPWFLQSDGLIQADTRQLSAGLYTLELRSGRQYFQVYWSKSDE
jgi:hypothetical protein